MNRFATILLACCIIIACYVLPAGSQPTLGIYYEIDPYSIYAMPEIYGTFDGYLILENADYNVTGIEFQVGICSPGIQITGFDVPPEATAYLGDPYSGMSIVYWPPLNGFMEDHLLLCTVHFINVGGCYFDGGPLTECAITALPHPDTGELRGTYAPDNDLFSVIGLTSIVCRYVNPPMIYQVNIEGFDQLLACFLGDPTVESAEDETRYRVVEHSSPPDTLTVVNATLHYTHSVLLTIERSMVDGMDYSFYATNICNEYSCSSEERYDFTFHAAIGTLLRSFSAEHSGSGIVITWQMEKLDDSVEFKILRSEGSPLNFEELPSTDIEKNGLDFRFTDRNIDPGHMYQYKIKYLVNGENRSLFETEPIETPNMPFTLYQNAPNPFNPSTTIRYYLPASCRVTLDIFDVGGKRIARLIDRTDGPGYRQVEWNGLDEARRTAASGIYLYRLTAGKETIAKKMVLLR